MSEFMISDAALAARLQEAQDAGEQTADFAALLSGSDRAEAPEDAKPGQVNVRESEKAVDAAEESPEAVGAEKAPAKEKAEAAPEDAEEDEVDEGRTDKATAEQMTFAALHSVELDSGAAEEFETLAASAAENAAVGETATVDPIGEETDAPVWRQEAPVETVEFAEGESAAETPKQIAATESNEELTPPELTEILKSVDAPDGEELPEEKPHGAAETNGAENKNAAEVGFETVKAAEAPETVAEAMPQETEPKRETPEKAVNVKAEDGGEETHVGGMAESARSEETAEYAEITERTAESAAEFTAETAEPAGTITERPKTGNGERRIETERTVAQDAERVEAEMPVRVEAKARTESGGTDAGSSERSFEAFAEAAEKGEISEPVIRTVTREAPIKTDKVEVSAEREPRHVETAEQPELTEPIMTRQTRSTDDRTSSIAEELEMLRNAKAKGAQTGERPMTAESAATDAPITIARENGERLEVKPSEVVEQATAKLVETAQTMKEQATEYSLVLNPEELGRIVVKLVKAADGAVSVSIAADNTRTQRILEQHSAAMQENLRDSGVKLEGWQMVRESEQETYAQDYNGSSKNPYYREESAPQSERDGEETDFAELIASM